MHTIIFVLSYLFVSTAGRERHLNFNLTDYNLTNLTDNIKPALLVVYAKICKHNNKETLNIISRFKIKLMLCNFQAQMSFLKISKGNYYVTISGKLMILKLQ